MAAMSSITRESISAAAVRIAGESGTRPLWRLPGRALGLDLAEVWLKLEQLQTSGSFKARGMFNRMRALPLPAAGVIVASGGNAGIAVATAAKALGVPCEVFVPEVSSAAKRSALAALGATVNVQGAAYADALAACLERQRETQALLMHAYDQPEVVAGAGTLAAEIEADAGVPTACSSASARRADRRRCRLVRKPLPGRGTRAVLRRPCMRRAKRGGRSTSRSRASPPIRSARPHRRDRVADHAAARRGVAPARRRGDPRAQQRLWRDFRLAVEPAAALPLAALWSGTVKPGRTNGSRS